MPLFPFTAMPKSIVAVLTVLLLLLSQRTNAQDKVSCEPEWTDPSELKFDGDAVVLLTHFTDRLDTEHATKPGLQKLVSFAKSNEVPFVYLHEEDADASQYFYNDCNPTAYVNSSLGEFGFNTGSLQHVILAGGFYELCFNNTFEETVANWSELRGKQELRITIVVDAIYGVASDSHTDDPFNADLRAWIREQPSETLLLNSVLQQLTAADAWKFLSRRWSSVPLKFGLHVRYKDVLSAIRFAEEGFPTIVIHYATADELRKRASFSRTKRSTAVKR